jgi:peptidyl-tRNA hydrolase
VKDEVLKVKYPAEDIKLVLIVREDLKMGKGKIGA